MNDSIWQTLITSFFTFLGLSIIALFQFKTAKAVREGSQEQQLAAFKAREDTKVVATKVKEVADIAAVTAENTIAQKGLTAAINDKLIDVITISKASQSIGIDTHTLVNSNMGVQLELTAAVSKRIASMTKDPEDIKASQLADVKLKDHIEKQAAVDERAATAPNAPPAPPMAN